MRINFLHKITSANSFYIVLFVICNAYSKLKNVVITANSFALILQCAYYLAGKITKAVKRRKRIIRNKDVRRNHLTYTKPYAVKLDFKEHGTHKRPNLQQMSLFMYHGIITHEFFFLGDQR